MDQQVDRRLGVLLSIRLGASAVLILAFALCLVAARDWTFSLLERFYGLQFANLPLMIYSTLPARALLAAATVAMLVLAIAASLLAPRRWRFLIVAATALIAASIAFRLMVAPKWVGLAVGGLFIVNAAPRPFLEALFSQRFLAPVANLVFGLGLVVAELLAPRPFWIWLQSKRKGVRPEPKDRLTHYGPSLLVAAALMALAPPYPALAKLGWTMARRPTVDRFYGKGFELYSAFDVAELSIDPATSRLFLCGDGLATVLVFHLEAMHAPPMDTGIHMGGAQFCTLDLARREFYAVDEQAGFLVVADLDTYAIKQRIGPLNFPSGETFVSKQTGSSQMLLASEDAKHDPSRPRMWLVDLTTGKFLQKSEVRAGYMFVHPTEPQAYASSYSDGFGLIALRLPSLQAYAQDAGDPRLDRIELDPNRDQILVASPLHSRVLAYDARTLAPRGAIKTEFGVRSMVVDETRDLLLTASLVTTGLDVIDLRSRRRVAQFRLGPWLRDIAVDPECGRAFVSSRHGVYAVQYAPPRQPAGRSCRSRP